MIKAVLTQYEKVRYHLVVYIEDKKGLHHLGGTEFTSNSKGQAIEYAEMLIEQEREMLGGKKAKIEKIYIRKNTSGIDIVTKGWY